MHIAIIHHLLPCFLCLAFINFVVVVVSSHLFLSILCVFAVTVVNTGLISEVRDRVSCPLPAQYFYTLVSFLLFLILCANAYPYPCHITHNMAKSKMISSLISHKINIISIYIIAQT